VLLRPGTWPPVQAAAGGDCLRCLAVVFGEHRSPALMSCLSAAGAGAEFPGNHESSQPGLLWPEFRPGSGELQDRDRGGRELDPDPLERIRITGSGAG
jgi:hypothetical protein